MLPFVRPAVVRGFFYENDIETYNDAVSAILENTDIDSLDLVHFGLVKNEMIKRGFLQENITNLNDYNASYLFNNRRALAHVPLTFIALDKPCYDMLYKLQQNLF